MFKRGFIWITKTLLIWGTLIGSLFLIYRFALLPYFSDIDSRDKYPTVRGFRIPYPPDSQWYTAKAIFEKEELPTIQSSQKGTVKSVLVAEGDMIDAGDPILKLDTTAYLARLQELRGILQDETLNASPEIPDSSEITETSPTPKTESKASSNKQPTEKQHTPRPLKKLSTVDLTDRATSGKTKTQKIIESVTETPDSSSDANRIALGDELLSDENLPMTPIDALRKEIGFLRWLIDDATIHSPVSGTINQILVKPGEKLLKEMPIIQLKEQTNPTIQLSLDPAVAGQLHLGQKMTVSFNDRSNKLHKLTAVFQGFDENSDLTHATIIVQIQPSAARNIQSLESGDSLTIGFQVINPEDTEIPCRATYPQNGTNWIVQMIRQNGHYQLLPKPIVMEAKSETHCQVYSGLVPGDLIAYPEINHPLPKPNSLVNVTYDETRQY